MTVVGATSATLLADLVARGEVAISRTVRVVSTAALAAATAWAADSYVVDGVSLGVPRAMLVAVPVLAGTWLLLSRRPGWGLLVLVAFSLVQAAGNNPIQRGVEPLTANPLALTIEEISHHESGDEGWIAFDLSAQVTGTLVASGVNSVSGLSFYPDRDAWEVLDPTHAFEGIWNRYAHLEFKAAPRGADTTMELMWADLIFLTVDPCSRALVEIGVRYVLAPAGLVDGCGRSVATVAYQGIEVEIRAVR